jgi:integrase
MKDISLRPCTALNVTGYDRWPELAPSEREALWPLLDHGPGARPLTTVFGRLHDAARLIQPLADALDLVDGDQFWKQRAMLALLQSCARQDQSFWGWDLPTWRKYLAPVMKKHRRLPASERVTRPHWSTAARQYMIAVAYLLGTLPDPSYLPDVRWQGVAEKVFGRVAVRASVMRVEEVVSRWGYSRSRCRDLRAITAEALIRSGRPELESLARLDLAGWRHVTPYDRRSLVFLLSKALAQLGVIAGPLATCNVGLIESIRVARDVGIPSEWREWVYRWEATTTLTKSTRASVRNLLLKIGRWLHETHPEVTRLEHWDRQLAAESVAAIDQMKVGDFTWRMNGPVRRRLGGPLSPRAKAETIQALRVFFQDAQEWEWIPRRFNPVRAFAVPLSIKALITPNPRTISDDIWAKLVWAGLNLRREDLPRFGRESEASSTVRETFYPEPMLRALALVWLFAGLRSDEIVRLRVGCIRWQQEDVEVPGRPGDVLARDAVCMLDVPTNKTGTAFTKPVDPLVGRAIAAWESIRAPQPAFIDRKTGESIQLLFCHRAYRLQKEYINHRLIPALCQKAGVPAEDTRGPITSHRARATIASQLYNAKDPMTLFELQAWLGHRSPESTQHYAKLTPLTLARAYTDAGYFARNVRAIEVLIDREAVEAGAAPTGSPWQYFDLGHGYCTYSFFEQCPHRMACPRCDFYLPKGSSKAQLLEAKANLQRMLVEIPLTEDERAAVQDGEAAVGRLLDRLADVPTPAGPTPRELAPARGRLLPVIQPPSPVRESEAER